MQRLRGRKISMPERKNAKMNVKPLALAVGSVNKARQEKAGGTMRGETTGHSPNGKWKIESSS